MAQYKEWAKELVYVHAMTEKSVLIQEDANIRKIGPRWFMQFDWKYFEIIDLQPKDMPCPSPSNAN